MIFINDARVVWGGKAMECLGLLGVMVLLFLMMSPYPYVLYLKMKYEVLNAPRPHGMMEK